MGWLRRVAGGLAVAAALWPLAVQPVASRAGSPRQAQVDVEKCAPIRGVARYGGLAYEHWVEVHNRCPRAVHCLVWTNVDPEPKHELKVPSGESRSVVIRIGSPAREFEAQGECRLAGR